MQPGGHRGSYLCWSYSFICHIGSYLCWSYSFICQLINILWRQGMEDCARSFFCRETCSSGGCIGVHVCHDLAALHLDHLHLPSASHKDLTPAVMSSCVRMLSGLPPSKIALLAPDPPLPPLGGSFRNSPSSRPPLVPSGSMASSTPSYSPENAAGMGTNLDRNLCS